MRPNQGSPILVGLIIPLAALCCWVGGLPLAGAEMPVAVEVTPELLTPGELARVAVTVEVPEGSWIYSLNTPPGPMPTSIRLDGLKWEWPPVESPTAESYEAAFNAVVKKHKGKATFTGFVRIPAGASGGELEIKGRVHGQICTEMTCAMIQGDDGRDGIGFGETLLLLPKARVAVKGRFDPPEAPPGGTATLVIDTEIAPGYHIYAFDTGGAKDIVPTQLRHVESAGLETVGAVEEPAAKSHRERGGGTLAVHEGKVTFRANLRVPEKARRGAVRYVGNLLHQVCDETSCIGPKEGYFAASLRIVSKPEAPPAVAEKGEAPPAVAEKAPSAKEGVVPEEAGESPRRDVDFRVVDTTAYSSAADFARFLEGRGGSEPLVGKGLLVLLLIAFLAGLLAVLTPCVYPMIPITISFFSKYGETHRGSAWSAGAIYGAGIIVSFTTIGLGLTLLAGPGGVQTVAGSPWTNGIIGLLFIAFALSLLGLFEIRLPRFLTDLAGRGQARGAAGGVVGILVLGLTFSIASFACTGPIVGAILAGSFSTHAVGPVVGMLGFSAGLALPFFLLAAVPARAAKMPRAGSWLVSVKVVLGLVVLATSFKFLVNADQVARTGILGRGTVIAIVVGISVVAALYLLGVFRMRDEDAPPRVGPFRVVGAVALLAVAGRLAPGLLGAPLGEWDALFPPADPRASLFRSDYRSIYRWEENLDGLSRALARARVEGRRVLVSFTGHG